MKLFKELTEDERAEFRKWARGNYKPYSTINGVWHPVLQAECVKMNEEAELIEQLGGPGGHELHKKLTKEE